MVQIVFIAALTVATLIAFCISPVYAIAFVTAFRTLFLLTTVPIGTYEYSAEGFLTLMIICFGFVFLMQKNLKEMKDAVLLPFVVFILYCAVTIIVADDYANYLKKLARLIGYFFLYLIVVDLSASERNRRFLSYAIVISALVTIVPGSYFYFIKPEMYMKAMQSMDKGLREIGIMSKNNFGFFCCYVTFFFIYLYLTSQKAMSKFISFIMILVSTSVLIISFTRAAWVGFVAALPSMVFASRNWKSGIMILFAIIMIGVAFSPIVYYGAVREITEKKEYGFSSWHFRLAYAWPASFKAFYEKPLMGWGLGNNRYALTKAAKLNKTSHNDYLLVLVETGIIGLALYLWLLLSLGRRTISGIRSAPDDASRILCVAALAIFITFIVGSGAEHLLQTPGATGHVITIVAMAHGSVSASGLRQAQNSPVVASGTG